MYRDSDGYILIDMGAADISKSTQSIVGFYDRIVESVEANKLVLVINFGTYSPMPAIAHKKLNYYEIVTNLYKITINSNDIVIIEETGESTVDVSIVPTLQEGVKIADFAIGEVEGSIYAPEQVDVINDNVTAENTTWSSDKIDDKLDTKADSSSLATVATSGSYADLTNKPMIPADLDDLSDVTLTSPANGQTLVYDSTSEQFVNATPPSGVTALSQLSDVTITSAADGNVLKYDGSTSKWVNESVETTASQVMYDNSDSGLEATKVQGAIDEVANAIKLQSEVFTLSFPSTITDLYIKYQNCYYCPITDEVHIAFAIYSASGKIPVQNAVFATIPEKYRPTVERNSGYAIVIPSSSGQYAPHIESINNVGTNGRLSLGNWLWGSTTTQILIVDFSYIR